MIPSVTDKSLISVTNWRRHTDPPFLWIFVFISSVSLHLLAFWFLRSSNEFRPWSPQSNQAEIPVDLIDISPQVQSKTQISTPKSPPLQKSVTASSPKIAPITPDNADDSAINSDFNLTEQGESNNTEVDSQEVQKPEAVNPAVNSTPTPTVQFTPTATPTQTIPSVQKQEAVNSTPTPNPPVRFTPQPQPSQTVPLNDLPWNRRQEVELGQGTLLPSDVPSDSVTPTPETSATPDSETSATPNSETSSTPNSETSSTPDSETSATPDSETSATPTGGSGIANVVPILKDEVIQLRQQKEIGDEVLPDVLAKYQGNSSKELELSLLPSNSGLKPANLLASLVIDKNGNFQQAIVLKIEPTTLSSEKGLYEQALNDIFKQESFLAAYNLNGSKPDLSNLYVRITIELINSP
jgi:hypothetical protein